MKGFVFTLDAIFSLVFATIAVSAIVYVSYSGYIPATLQSSEASSIAATLSSTALSSLGPASPLYGAGSRGVWPEYGAGSGLSFGSAYGPSGPYLMYAYPASANIIPAVVASGGDVAFAAANALYEINATTGLSVQGYPLFVGSANIVSTPLYGKGSLVYANAIGYVTAVSPSNGLVTLWRTTLNSGRATTPLELDDGYIIFGARSTSGGNSIYVLDPSNGSIIANYIVPSSIYWIAHYNGAYYIGSSAGISNMILSEYVNNEIYPSNSFSSYGNYEVVDNLGTAAMYANLTAYYGRASGILNLTSVPYYDYPHRSSFALPAAEFNTTPSVGGNTTYLLYNGLDLEAFNQGGSLFSSPLPGMPSFSYNYSDIALAYGNAYVAQGSTLYAFGAGGYLQQNESLLTALGDLYLTGRGGLADYMLYSTLGTGGVGIFVNNSYGPSLHVASFNSMLYSYVDVPNSAQLDPSDPLSLIAYVDPSNYPSGGNSAFVAGKWGGSANQYFLGISSNGNVITRLGNSIDSNWNVAPVKVPLNSWSQIGLVYNGSEELAIVNGQEYPLAVASGSTSIAAPGALGIGAELGSGTPSIPFVGSIADVLLYNVSISQQAASGMYSSGIYAEPSNTTSLVGWWPLLGDGNDYSGNGHVGFPSNVFYTTANYLPPSLNTAAQVSRASIPLELTNNGISKIYNVSVVIWSN